MIFTMMLVWSNTTDTVKGMSSGITTSSVQRLLNNALVMPSYLFYFAHAHNEFRLPELKSIAELYGFPMLLPQDPDDRDPTRPCMVIGLEEEEHARILGSRCILIKCVLGSLF